MYDKLTKKDIALMEAELEDRRLNQRPKIIEEVKRTREFGDLSENYEYKAAKQAQRRNDSRMRYLENMIKTAQIIDDGQEGDPSQLGRVKLYDRVTVYLPEDDETMTIQIVSTVRIDPNAGFISMESPLGKAVLGAAVGDVVKVRVNDSYSYEVEVQAVENAEDDGSAPLMQY
ncbi:MAG: transcription elongation factor GreA [Clostridiales bacterium]|nr:transcription elongation factor GreA [Clostridiales bacterium]